MWEFDPLLVPPHLFVWNLTERRYIVDPHDSALCLLQSFLCSSLYPLIWIKDYYLSPKTSHEIRPLKGHNT